MKLARDLVRVSMHLSRRSICRLVQVGDVLHQVALLDLHTMPLKLVHILPF